MQIRTEYTESGERIVQLVEDGLMVTLRGEDATAMLALHDREEVLRGKIATIAQQRWSLAGRLFRQRRQRATEDGQGR